MPIKRYPRGDAPVSDAAENPTELGQAPDMPTEVVPPPTPLSDVGPTAWAEADDIAELDDDRRPLSVALMALLAGVVIGWIGLGPT